MNSLLKRQKLGIDASWLSRIKQEASSGKPGALVGDLRNAFDRVAGVMLFVFSVSPGHCSDVSCAQMSSCPSGLKSWSSWDRFLGGA